ncbi:MAG: nucleoside deaminase [Ginsengibacter sp.]
MTREEMFMSKAIALSERNIIHDEGGPFGCIVVKGDHIIGSGNNKVITNMDPTAHAEIVAIRDACKNLGSYQLDGCEIYTSCEPCPMCLGAIYWARPQIIYYANTHSDAASAGFDDSFIYQEINQPVNDRKIPMKNISREQALKVFIQWGNKTDKSIY